MILFFDTETTGLVQCGQPLSHQPYLLQLGAALYDDDGESEAASFNLLVRPPYGMVVPPEATRVHGLTAQHCFDGGVSLHMALLNLQCFCALADRIVCYNAEFDTAVIRAECERLRIGLPWNPKLMVECAMLLAAEHCPQRDHAGRSKYPKLVSAYEYFFGEPFDQQHEALADVRATARVWFHCQAAAREEAAEIRNPQSAI